MLDKINETASQYQLIFGYLGGVTMLVGGIVLLPLLLLIAFPEEIVYAQYFIIPGVSAILLGYLLTFFIKGKEKGNLQQNQDAVIVVSAWIIAVFFSSLPFILTGQYSFTQGVFEAASGWTTTGFTVIDVTKTPHLFLMFRSITHFFGGIGLVLVMLSVLSDNLGMRLYNAEGHSDKLLPNVLKSSRMIVGIYAGYILTGTVLYIIFGMPWFDALNHSIAAVATGGFSTQPDSIGHYHSFPIEMVSILLMLWGNTSFLAHLYLLRGKVANFTRYCEVQFLLFLIVTFIPVLALVLWTNHIGSAFSESLRIALFQGVSAFTTTGFQTVSSIKIFPSAALLLLIILMLIGGGAGSTSGGIKQYWVYVMLKSIVWIIRDKLSNKRVVRADRIKRPNTDQYLTPRDKWDIGVFVFLYLVVFLIGAMILTGFGYSVGDALFEFASSLGGVGLSVGIMGAAASPGILWTGIMGMFIGRLEIYVVILAAIRLCADGKNGLEKVCKK